MFLSKIGESKPKQCTDTEVLLHIGSPTMWPAQKDEMTVAPNFLPGSKGKQVSKSFGAHNFTS